MKTLILVSPHFPPSALAGVHRARLLVKYLPMHGWRPIVVRVESSFYTERNDPSLAKLVPIDLEQVNVGAIPSWMTRPFGLGDIGLRAYFSLRRAIERAVRKERAEAILITGSPFYPMALAEWAKKKLGVPVVLDFQDPWVSSEGALQPKWSKAWLAHQLALRLEPMAVRNADFITSVSERQNEEMAARYPWLDPKLMAAIPIGGDPGDYESGSTMESNIENSVRGNEYFEFAYVGSVWPRALPTLRVLLKAISILAQKKPSISCKLRFNFYGTDARLIDPPIYQVSSLAEQMGIQNIVNEHPRRLSYLDALGKLRSSDCLLLFGSDEPHYTASKIYPALMSGRPYFSLFHRGSSAHDTLCRAGGGEALSFASSAELMGLENQIAEALYRLATRQFPMSDPAVWQAFHARAIAGRFAEVFDAVMRLHARPSNSSLGK